ncbi:nodulation protein NfeD [Iocasia frigidifontis]|uniref:Nodulation protein NfeD n=1 Tax=Iocasia fonsfrigidae TaxID=2682810 RepID=A0A8A7KJB0_9FIRM|nr:NfeD family protein [Iocasia fonsfrigidae]QTL97962.1 nodulation protein NfeD [Iocasia fonsfrigidae]
MRGVKYVLGLMVLFIVLSVLSVQAVDRTEIVYKIPITGEIDRGLVYLVKKGISEAEAEGADLLIFEIDTFGGYVDSAIEIKDLIYNSRIKTLTFVKGRAWSAGALITLAGDIVAMVPGSSIGAAETRPKEEKYISALRKEFKATAESRGRYPEIAAAMVDSDLEIEGLIAAGKLLTLTADEAVTHNMAEYKVGNLTELYDIMDFSPARILSVQVSSAEKLARFIINPNISTVLLTIGLIALIAETFIMGWGIAGTAGLLSLGLVFSSYIYLGVAGWGVVVLLVVGLVLLALEVFVVPGFGITGISGILAILASFYFLFPTPTTALFAVATVLILSIAAAIVILKLFGGSQFWQRISLGESQTKDLGYIAQYDKKEYLGKTAYTLTPLRPAGLIEIDAKRLDVVSDGGFIDKDVKVKIIKITGNRVVVKQIKEDE